MKDNLSSNNLTQVIQEKRKKKINSIDKYAKVCYAEFINILGGKRIP